MSNQAIVPLNDIITEFTSNCMVKIKNKKDDGSTLKVISFDDYCKAILAARNRADNGGEIVDSPIYPQNPLVSTVQVRTLATGASWYFITRNVAPFDFPFYDTVFKNVGIPKLVFAVKILDNVVQTASVVAVKDFIITEATKIYEYPFSNTFERGRICFGGNRITTFDFKNVEMLHSFPNMFLSMPSNNDNYRDKNYSHMELRPLLELLEGETFPNDWLKPTLYDYKAWKDSFH